MITALGLNKNDEPKLVLINRGSRKRFRLYDGEITEENLQKFLILFLLEMSILRHLKEIKFMNLMNEFLFFLSANL